MLLPAAAAVVVAGCGSGSKPSSSPTTTVPSTAPPSTGATASVPTSTTGSPATTAPATTAPATTATTGVGAGSPGGLSECPTGRLSATVGSPNGTAGIVYYTLALRNIGHTACFVQGYPGVSFVAGSNGHQVGAPARRVAGPTPRVVIQPGDGQSAVLGVVAAANFGSSCSITQVGGLRVYPPDQRAALYVAHPFEACANPADVTLTIRPLGAGTS